MTPAKRKEVNDEKIKAQGIAVNPYLPFTAADDEVKLKSFDEICNRAIASLLTVQIALDAANGEHKEAIEYFSDVMDRYGIKDKLNANEQAVYDGTFDQQQLANVAWEYECYWALVWALGLIGSDELEKVGEICDCEKAIAFVRDNGNDLRAICRLRSKEEILDELDYFYRLHWACVQHRIKPDTPIGSMDEEVVMERRRGLEWLISDKDDWFDISLDT